MIVELSPVLRRHVRAAVGAYLRQLERDAKRNGTTVPAEITELYAELDAHPVPVPDPQARRRESVRDASRRSRARAKGVDIPKLKPGPKLRILSG